MKPVSLYVHSKFSKCLHKSFFNHKQIFGFFYDPENLIGFQGSSKSSNPHIYQKSPKKNKAKIKRNKKKKKYLGVDSPDVLKANELVQ
jgi:hypothetical protein